MSLKVMLVLEAIDRATRPIAAVKSALGGLSSAAGGIADRVGGIGERMKGVFTVDRLGKAAEVERERLAGLRSDMVDAAAAAALIAAPIKAAMDFGHAMAGVGKVANVSGAALDGLGRQAMATSDKLGVPVDGIAKMMEFGAKLQLPLDQLAGFGAQAAVMGTAWDMSAEKAGKALADLRAIFKLDAVGAGGMADAINHLSNNMNAMPSAITDVMARAGAAGTDLRLSGQQIAAMGSTLLALKVPAEVAGTSMQALFQKLGTVDRQGKKFGAALDQLGLPAEKFKAMMQRDAQGAILTLLGSLKAAGPEMQGLLLDMFGMEYADDVGRLVSGLDEYKRALALVTDPGAYAGSMQGEFDALAASDLSKFNAALNALRNQMIGLGIVLMPPVTALLATVRPIIDAVGQWAAANPALASTLAHVVAGAVAARLAFAALAYALAWPLGPLIRLIGLFVKFNAAGKNVALAARAFAGLKAIGAATASVTGLGRAFGLLRAILVAPLSFAGGLIGGIGDGIAAAGGARAVLAALAGRVSALTARLSLLLTRLPLIGGALARLVGLAPLAGAGLMALARSAAASAAALTRMIAVGALGFLRSLAAAASIAAARLLLVGRQALVAMAGLARLGAVAAIAGLRGLAGAAAIAGAGLATLGRVVVGAGAAMASALMLAARAAIGFGAALMATPIGWIIALVAAIVAVAAAIYFNWGGLGDIAARIWATVKARLVAGWEAVKSWWAGLSWPSLPSLADVGDLFAGLKARLVAGWEAVKGWWPQDWPSLPSLTDVGDLFAGLKARLAAGWEAVKGWWPQNWPSLPAFPDIGARIDAAFDAVITRLAAGWDKVKGWFKDVEWPSLPDIGSLFGGNKLADSLPADPAALERIAGATGAIRASVAGVAAVDAAGALAKVTAIGDAAKAARDMVDALAPAASTARAAVEDVFAGLSFHSHGVRMMTTLAAGIRAGAGAAVAAARETVQAIRDHLPHSPAKVGPLSDLDRVRFGQTLAGAIARGAPAAIDAVGALAAGLAGALPTVLAAPAMAAAVPLAHRAMPGAARGRAEPVGAAALPPALRRHPALPSIMPPSSPLPSADPRPVAAAASDRPAGPIHLTLSPSITVQGGAGAGTGDIAGQIEAALKSHAYELVELVQAELRRRGRAAH